MGVRGCTFRAEATPARAHCDSNFYIKMIKNNTFFTSRWGHMTKSCTVSNGNFTAKCIFALPEITFSLKRSHISGMGRTRSQKPKCSVQKGVPILRFFVQIWLHLCITVPSPELLCASGWGDFRYRRGCEQWRSRSAAIEVGCDCVHTPEAFQVG